MAIKARSRALGPFHPSFDVNKIIYESLVKTLPDDAHIKANGRLFISVTRISDGKNVIINKFKSKEELIKVSIAQHTYFWSFSKDTFEICHRMPVPKYLSSLGLLYFGAPLHLIGHMTSFACTAKRCCQFDCSCRLFGPLLLAGQCASHFGCDRGH